MTSMTRDEYVAVSDVKTRRAERGWERLRGLAMLSQAAVEAEILTGHPAWDKYLSYLQSFVDETRALQEGYERKLSDPLLVDHSEMLRAKIGARECAAMALAVSKAMELPKDIIQNGDEAKDLLSRMEPE